MRRAYATLFAAFLHFDISFAIWGILGPLALFIAKDLNLSIVQKGFLVSVPPLGGAFFRIVLGLLSDRFGAKRVGVASMALTLVPLVLGWLAGSTFGMMIAVGLLLGIAGASFAVSLPLAAGFRPKNKGSPWELRVRAIREPCSPRSSLRCSPRVSAGMPRSERPRFPY
ncbi:MAG: MFS transporter [Candidatus Eremiobacteraeota bacterium]|nr:MFS transporter [Candidatus Eremiobacteraeota bacterium]